jgi:hypothetical protein
VYRWRRRLCRIRIPLPGALWPPGRTAAQLRYGLERKLHDGAAAEISALALELGVLSASIEDAAAEATLASAQRRITHVLDELRQVGAAIYPSVLTSGGLGPGLAAVAERCGLRLRVDLPCAELGEPALSRTCLLVSDYFHTLRPGSVVRVWVRGRRIVRVRITDHQPGDATWREHRAVLRCG